jgi:Protein of unknown function (DUF1580)
VRGSVLTVSLPMLCAVVNFSSPPASISDRQIPVAGSNYLIVWPGTVILLSGGKERSPSQTPLRSLSTTHTTSPVTSMIDRNSERLVPIKEVPSLLSIDSKPPCYETIRQWACHGVRGVELEIVWIGHRMYTSKQAVDRFLEATRPGQSHAAVVLPGRVNEKAYHEASRRLREKFNIR